MKSRIHTGWVALGSAIAALVLSVIVVVALTATTIPPTIERNWSPEAKRKVLVCDVPEWAGHGLVQDLSGWGPLPTYITLHQDKCPERKPRYTVTIEGTDVDDIFLEDNGLTHTVAYTTVYRNGKGQITGGHIRLLPLEDMRQANLNKTDKTFGKLVLAHELAHAFGWASHAPEGEKHLMAPHTKDLAARFVGMNE